MSRLVNFYTDVKDVRRHLDTDDDPQQQLTGVKANSRILFCGASGSGKTNALLNFIFLAGQGAGTFSHIFLACRVDEPLYEFLAERVNHKGRRGLTIYKSLADFPSVEEFVDASAMPKNRKERFLCIFDDMVTETDAASARKLKQYYAFSRKKNITCAFLSQSYFSTLKFVRDNVNYIILNSIRSVKDLDRILREYNLGDVTQQQLHNMFLYATAEPLSFLKIDTGGTAGNRRFSKGFTEYLDPRQF